MTTLLFSDWRQRFIYLYILDSGKNTPLDLALSPSACVTPSLCCFVPLTFLFISLKQISAPDQTTAAASYLLFFTQLCSRPVAFSIAQFCKQESGVCSFLFVPCTWSVGGSAGAPMQLHNNVFGIQDGREGSHKNQQKEQRKAACRKAIVKWEQTEAKGIVDLVFPFVNRLLICFVFACLYWILCGSVVFGRINVTDNPSNSFSFSLWSSVGITDSG